MTLRRHDRDGSSDRNECEQIRREGRKRLYPSLSNPNWLVLRKRREVFTKWLQDASHVNSVVLDVGGRIQPYRPLIEGPSLYVALDLIVTPTVDVVSNAAHLPIRSDCIDLVLCTQMLEYASDPQLVIHEIRRVLKPGGFLVLSAPAVFPQDADHDCWRFLPGALRKLLTDFSSFDLAAEGSSLSGLIRTLNVCAVSFVTARILRSLLCYTIVPALNLLGATLEILNFTKDTSFTANFSVRAQK